MAAWLKRFGLHLAAAVGATGVFVAAAAVGANQTHPQAGVATPPIATVVRAEPTSNATPAVQVSTPTPRQRLAAAVRPERSLAGTVQSVGSDSLTVVGVGGRTWTVQPAPGALIRLNGKTARLDALQAGDGVVILGQAQPRPGLTFLAHAITAKAK